MRYTYVLLSNTDGRCYTGTPGDLRRRIRQHREGQVRSTSYRRPLRLMYDEACLSAAAALRRERCIKTGKGKRYRRHRLATFLSETGHNKLERH